MDVKVIKDIDSLVLYKKEWERILEDNNNDNPFLEFEWIYNWWNFLSKGYELFVTVVLDDNNNILGFGPFMKLNKIGYSEIYFIGYPESNYGDLVIFDKYKYEAVRVLIDYLLSLKERFVFRLHGFIEDNSHFRIIKNYLDEKGVKFFIKSVNSYYIKSNDVTFNEYYKSRKKHNSFRNITKDEKSLGKFGDLHYKRLDNSRIDEIFKLHLKRWKKKNDNSNFAKGRVMEFFRHMALNEGNKIKTKATSLTLNEKLIAFGYGFECRGRCVMYRTAFDDDFRSYGIGKIILKDIIEECFNKGLDILDLSIGYERYKTDFTDSCTKVSNIVFPSNSYISNIVFQIYCIKAKFIRFLKRSKVIVNFKRNTMSNLRYILSFEFISNKISRIRNLIKRKGILRAGIEPIYRLFSFFYFQRNYIIYEINLGKLPKVLMDYKLKAAGIDDLKFISETMDVEPFCIVDRFKKGDKCFKLYYENRIVSIIWVSFSRVCIEGKTYDINLGDSSLIYEYFMIPFNKSKHYYKALPLIMRDAFDFNVKSCFTWVDERDRKLIKSLETLGFKQKYSIKTIGFFKWIRCLIKEKGEV